jgi:hypothetical protein
MNMCGGVEVLRSRPTHRYTYSISTRHHSTHWSSYIGNIQRINTTSKIVRTYVTNGPITLIVPLDFIYF